MRLAARSLAILTVAATVPLFIGGQAVMEGVMMKSQHHVATAVRKEDGTIALSHRREVSFAERYRLNRYHSCAALSSSSRRSSSAYAS